MTWTRVPMNDDKSAAVPEAQRTLHKLERDLAKAEDTARSLAEERRGLAFDASTGDKGARKALDALNERSLRTGLQIDDLRAAIAEAKRLVVQAETNAALAAELARRRQIAELAAHLPGLAARCDAALAEFCSSWVELEAQFAAIRRLGLDRPSGQTVSMFGRRALTTQLLTCSLSLQFLVPGDRTNFAAMVERLAPAGVPTDTATVDGDDDDGLPSNEIEGEAELARLEALEEAEALEATR